MEFKDFKINNTYFSVSSGQYIGAFYVLQRNDKVMKVLISYYGGLVRVEIVEEEDLENELEWMHNSFHINKKPNDSQLKESLQEMIAAIFEKRNVASKLTRGRK
ncbi:MAG: hypothetical protein ACOCRO_01775 [Halanaerobiales bacterium]